MRPSRTLLALVSALAVGLGVVGVVAWRGSLSMPAASATKRGDDDAATRPALKLAKSQIVDHDAWTKPGSGFVEMVPPVRLPTDLDEVGRIQVFLRIPEGKLIDVAVVNGRATLRFPEGTLADRVESYRFRQDQYSVTDVRGTLLAPRDEELFHVFVPTTPRPREPLVGWEWKRGDRKTEDAVTSELVDVLRARGDTEERGVERYRRNNDCARCHVHNKRENTSRRRGIHRATDDSGFFVPLTVLEGESPFETHRPRDMNVGDPFLTLSCPSGSVPTLQQDGRARHYRCADGGAPVGKLDVVAALRANDARTIGLCKSRAYLREHMDEAARTAFSTSFAECGL